ncbi:peptidyl-tRNA hydrolase [Bounagaea algeriensis]
MGGVSDTAAVLEPLLARYATWMRLPSDATADTSDEDPEAVVLMPLVLRLERNAPPARSDLLAAAAAAALAVCVDERSEPGGAWHDAVLGWTSGRIRKVARRARGSHWRAVEELPGRTVQVGRAQVRAFPPCRVADMPKELTRLQISGSELDADSPGPPRPDAPVLWLNPDAPMSAGKTAAQVGHATMFLAALLRGTDRHDELQAWIEAGLPCSVRVADDPTWRRFTTAASAREAWFEHGVAFVRDAGFTEIDPGTVTVAVQWPGDRSTG